MSLSRPGFNMISPQPEFIPLLPPLEDEIAGENLENLTLPHFFVPCLIDKPQNPIVELLNAAATSRKPHIGRLVPRLGISSRVGDTPDCRTARDNVWFDAVRRASASRVSVTIPSLCAGDPYQD